MITNNFGLKLLAIVISCGLWFMVDSITDPVERKVFNNWTGQIPSMSQRSEKARCLTMCQETI